jgi:hypothetical protein
MEKTHNQIDHVLIDRRRQYEYLISDLFRGADSDTDHYLVVTELRKRLSVSERSARNFDMQRFDLTKLKYAAVKEQYRSKS